jgi:hypothetical protein
MNQRKRVPWLNLEFVFLVALALYGLSFIRESRNLNPTAAAFPQWVAALVLLFVGIRLGSSIYRYYRPRAGEVPSPDAAETAPGIVLEEIKPGQEGVVELPAKPTHWCITVLLMGLLFIAIGVLGFPVSSLLFLFGASLLMGYRKTRVVLLYSFVMTGFLFGMLIWFFQIPIPGGLLIKLIRGY